MLPTTSKTELNAHCDGCRTMHTCPTLNIRNVLQTPAHSAYWFRTKCSISKKLPMPLLRFWKRNSSTFLINSNWITSNIRPWKDDSSLTCKSTLLSVSTRLVTIFTRESAPAETLAFVWFCLNRINGQRGMVRRGCHLWVCSAMIVGFARSSNDVQVKRTWIFAYQIKTHFHHAVSCRLK